MEIVWQRVPGCRVCNRKRPTAELGATVSWHDELMATCRVEPLATGSIGRRLAAVDEVLRSVALQTPMNSHSELKLDTLRNISQWSSEWSRRVQPRSNLCFFDSTKANIPLMTSAALYPCWLRPCFACISFTVERRCTATDKTQTSNSAGWWLTVTYWISLKPSRSSAVRFILVV